MAQIDWLAGLAPSAALHPETMIRAGLGTLAVFPEAGRLVNAEERKWLIPFGRDGFVVSYRIEAERVVIGRIFHARQDRD